MSKHFENIILISEFEQRLERFDTTARRYVFQFDAFDGQGNPLDWLRTCAETYSSPHSDALISGHSGGSGSGSLPPAGSNLSAHHEIQLLKEQLEQQSQQTQATMAQLQLTMGKLAAEKSARREAEKMRQQLLIQKKDLLDHISDLVARLQQYENAGQQQTPPHMIMPQQQQQHFQHQQQQPVYGESPPSADYSENASLDNSSLTQAFGVGPLGLIENRAVTSCLPSSPLRSNFSPPCGVFNFTYPPPVDTSSLDAQLMQRLQSLGGYITQQASPYPYAYGQTLPFVTPGQFNQQPYINNNYATTLQTPPQKKMMASPLPARHSFPTSSEQRLGPGRNSEPRQTTAPPVQQQFQSQQNLSQSQDLAQNLQVQQNVPRASSPRPQDSPESPIQREGHFIKPLTQMGTLTTTDSDGRVRVIVPVPSNSNDEIGTLMTNLRVSDDFKPSNIITRSTSEKVPNRSELMSQVQRTAWARHTTK